MPWALKNYRKNLKTEENECFVVIDFFTGIQSAISIIEKCKNPDENLIEEETVIREEPEIPEETTSPHQYINTM